MKKWIALLCAASMVGASLSGCAKDTSSPGDTEDGKLRIVSTIFAPYDFTREIAGGDAEITMLLPPAAESHSFEPTPRDIITIQNCDVFIYVGGESDAWVEDVLSSMDTSKMKMVSLMDCVEVVEEEIVECMEDEHHDEDEDSGEHEEEHEYDEHVWTSPKNAQRIVQKISDTLCEADVVHAADYKTRTEAYIKELDALDAAFQDVVDHAQRKTLVFGDRFPFRYLADAYGLSYFAAFPGCSTETEASAATVKFLIDKINAEKIPVVFHIELSNEKMTDTIEEATGAKPLLLHAVHNITKEDFEKGIGYLDLMKQNVENLKEALQ